MTRGAPAGTVAVSPLGASASISWSSTSSKSVVTASGTAATAASRVRSSSRYERPGTTAPAGRVADRRLNPAVSHSGRRSTVTLRSGSATSTSTTRRSTPGSTAIRPSTSLRSASPRVARSTGPAGVKAGERQIPVAVAATAASCAARVRMKPSPAPPAPPAAWKPWSTVGQTIGGRQTSPPRVTAVVQPGAPVANVRAASGAGWRSTVAAAAPVAGTNSAAAAARDNRGARLMLQGSPGSDGAARARRSAPPKV